MPSLNIDGKHFCFTIWTELGLESILAQLDVKFSQLGKKVERYLLSREIGKESGKAHVHAYFVLNTKIRRSIRSDYFDGEGYEHPQIEHTRSEKNWARYCLKDGNYITNFPEKSITSFKEGKAKTAKEIGKEIIEGKSLKEVVQENPQYVLKYDQLKKSVLSWQNDTRTLRTLRKLRNVWIYGPPGTGKTHAASELCPEGTYIKDGTKWWEGYSGEEVVILEDVGPDWERIEQLKLVADKKPYIGEIKGASIRMRPRRIIATSNYDIPELLRLKGIKDKALEAALERRFDYVYFDDRQCAKDIPEDSRSSLLQENGENPDPQVDEPPAGLMEIMTRKPQNPGDV